jgi:hypothetical protein
VQSILAKIKKIVQKGYVFCDIFQKDKATDVLLHDRIQGGKCGGSRSLETKDGSEGLISNAPELLLSFLLGVSNKKA